MKKIADIDKWLKNITLKLKAQFGPRLLFIGLQGSYKRGEATPDSDIDLVVILDVLNFEDLKIYRSIINDMPHKDKACGFISGKSELQKWSKADLFQFFYDTKPLLGKLDVIIKAPSKEEIKQSIKIGAENIYHAAVHSFVHSKNYKEDLQNLYKMTFFVLQAKYFIKTDEYVPTKKDLSGCLLDDDEEVLSVCINKQNIKNKASAEIESLYSKLINWAGKNI